MRYTIDYERGEMSLTLCDEKYELRLDHKALAKIKAELGGETTLQVCGRLFGARHDESTLAVIIGHSTGAKDFGPIEDHVLREGIVHVVEPVREYMTLAVNGFRPAKEKKSGMEEERPNIRSGDF